MGARRMSRGACAHAWSAGDLGSWLRVQGVEDVVDLDAGELVLVGERFLDGVGDDGDYHPAQIVHHGLNPLGHR